MGHPLGAYGHPALLHRHARHVSGVTSKYRTEQIQTDADRQRQLGGSLISLSSGRVVGIKPLR
jgi:hypothetical protein